MENSRIFSEISGFLVENYVGNVDKVCIVFHKRGCGKRKLAVNFPFWGFLENVWKCRNHAKNAIMFRMGKDCDFFEFGTSVRQIGHEFAGGLRFLSCGGFCG